ncbi:MAG: hypothetical protein H0V34_07415 [Gammaproteobacteria bacterium]|nr:hypothetical protein [Gammaproteobacteria bacterium]
MFLHTLFDVIHTIWNSLYVMPASQNGGAKPMQQKSESSKHRASRASRDAEEVAAGYGGSSSEHQKLQAEDDCVVLLCRD